jgi:serine/threonine protein kinase
MFSTFNQKYEMKEKIGIGGFAEVFKVKNKETSEIFAVKIFHKNDLYLNEKISSLYNEINFLKLFSNINHENLVKTYEIYENQNDIYCIIDYVSNNNLYNYLIKNPNITLKEIKKIIKQILNGISYIETLGIIHQDLKLENIMIKEDNNNNTNIKIIDFGLSIILLKNEFLRNNRNFKLYGT